ncbi:hypothetical protein WDU94_000681 [Cyamophila willieti]
MRGFQRTNHFPFIGELCRKNMLTKNINNMKKQFPTVYDFFPTTWILPRDKREVQAYLANKKAFVILKPENDSRGSGIVITRNPRHIESKDNYICQKYIANPFLIDGYKFDIRVYVLLTSCDPMRIYAHDDGIVRFATVKYETPGENNLNNHFMHLTNSAVNKNSTSYIYDDEYGSKRHTSKINDWFKRYGYKAQEVWSRIDDLIVKTMLSAHSKLKEKYNATFTKHKYSTACFQLLGFDILLDEDLNAFLLEVNSSPSFNADTDMEKSIKERVITDTFLLCNLKHSIKEKVKMEEKAQTQKRLLGQEAPKRNNSYKAKQWAWERENKGNYRLLYPFPEADNYTLLTSHKTKTKLHYNLINETSSSNIQAKLVGPSRNNFNAKNNGIKTKHARIKEMKSEAKTTVKPDERTEREFKLLSQNNLNNETSSSNIQAKLVGPSRNNFNAKNNGIKTKNARIKEMKSEEKTTVKPDERTERELKSLSQNNLNNETSSSNIQAKLVGPSRNNFNAKNNGIKTKNARIKEMKSEEKTTVKPDERTERELKSLSQNNLNNETSSSNIQATLVGASRNNFNMKNNGIKTKNARIKEMKSEEKTTVKPDERTKREFKSLSQNMGQTNKAKYQTEISSKTKCSSAKLSTKTVQTQKRKLIPWR